MRFEDLAQILRPVMALTLADFGGISTVDWGHLATLDILVEVQDPMLDVFVSMPWEEEAATKTMK